MDRNGVLPESNCTEPVAAAAERPKDFFDIDTTPWRSGNGEGPDLAIVGIFVSSLVVLFVLCGTLFWLGRPEVIVIPLIGMLLTGIILLRIFSTDDDLDEVFRQHAEKSNAELVGMSFRRMWVSGSRPVDPFLRAVVANRRTGITLRLGRPRRQFPISPIRYPFDATPLNEAVDSFVELESAHPLDSAEVKHTERTKPGQDTFPRKFKRVISLNGGWIIFVFMLIFLAWTLVTYRFLSRWSPVMLVAIGMALRYVIFNLGSTWTSRRQWILVPGGVVIRRAKTGSKDWNPRLFSRGESALAVVHQSADAWKAFVVGEDVLESATLTERECRLLLRAWLSPVTPPPLDRMTDLQ